VFEVTKISIFLLQRKMSFFALLTKFKGLSVAVGFFWQQYVVDFQV